MLSYMSLYTYWSFSIQIFFSFLLMFMSPYVWLLFCFCLNPQTAHPLHTHTNRHTHSDPLRGKNFSQLSHEFHPSIYFPTFTQFRVAGLEAKTIENKILLNKTCLSPDKGHSFLLWLQSRNHKADWELNRTDIKSATILAFPAIYCF